MRLVVAALARLGLDAAGRAPLRVAEVGVVRLVRLIGRLENVVRHERAVPRRRRAKTEWRVG